MSGENIDLKQWHNYEKVWQRIFESLPLQQRLEIVSDPRSDSAADLALQALELTEREAAASSARGPEIGFLHHRPNETHSELRSNQ